MSKAALILFLVCVLIGAGFWVGKNWDRAADANAAAETLERIDNADVGEGDPAEDAGWIDRFLDRVRPGE